MKLTKTLFVILFYANYFSQSNLINNSSFEFGKPGQSNAPCRVGLVDLLDVWQGDPFYPGGCVYENCNGNYCGCEPCITSNSGDGFHTTDWFKVIENIQSNGLGSFATMSEMTNIPDPNNFGAFKRYKIKGHNNTSEYVGMAKSELIQQNFFNSNPIIGGKTYVFSAYVRIPKKGGANNSIPPQFNSGANCTAISFSLVNKALTISSNIGLNVFLASQKIKYANNTFLLCGSDGSSDFKNLSTNNITKLNTINININSQPYYQWHRVSFEFVCPSNHNYEWIGLELDKDATDEPDSYLLIDDVSIVEKCDLGCTSTSGQMNPLISSWTPNFFGCLGAQVTNIGNVKHIVMEVFTTLGQLIRTDVFHNDIGFSGPVYWYGYNFNATPVAAGLYLVRVTCTNDCRTEVFSNQVLFGGDCNYQYVFNPLDNYTNEIAFKDCCELNFVFTNKTFNIFNQFVPQYYYKPRNDITITSCNFTSISMSTLKAGHEVIINGETSISPGVTGYNNYTAYIPDFHALIEECDDAHRLIQTENNVLTDKDFVFYDNMPTKNIVDSKILSEKTQNQLEFNIIPNPNNGTFKLTLNNNNELPKQITIVDAQGRLVKTIQNPTEYEYNFDINELNGGLYIINALYNTKSISKRFIKN